MNTVLSEESKKAIQAPAFHYIIFDQTSILHQDYEGKQDVENEIDVNEQTSFHAFSVTKTFTAVAVLQLAEKGLLSLDDPIGKHLPTFEFSQPVSIRQLLSHQSGIANPLPLRWTHLAEEHPTFDHRGFSESVILKHLKLKRKPGVKYSYSNINYLVLGLLLEEISGMTYERYIQENLLQRLPSRSKIGFDLPDTNHAMGYHKNSWFQNLLLGLLFDTANSMYPPKGNWRRFKPFYINGLPYGGLICTPAALMEFCRALLNGNEQLLSRTAIQEMLTPQRTAKGDLTPMGLGWFSDTLKDVSYYCHAGGGGGYYSEIRVYPEKGMGSVVMMNRSGMKDERLLDRLDAAFIL